MRMDHAVGGQKTQASANLKRGALFVGTVKIRN